MYSEEEKLKAVEMLVKYAQGRISDARDQDEGPGGARKAQRKAAQTLGPPDIVRGPFLGGVAFDPKILAETWITERIF